MLLRLAFGALTGALAYVAATITTVVVPDALFWRTFWLVVCIVAFVALLAFLAMAMGKFDNHPETHS